MVKVVALFLILTALIGACITAFQKMSGRQALTLTKSVFLATISASVAVALMFVFVEIF